MVRVEYGGQKSQLTFRVVVDLATLSAQQISQVKKQLDDELEHLTNHLRSSARHRQSSENVCGP